MNIEVNQSQHEVTAQQLANAAEVQRNLSQPSPWLVEAGDEAAQSRIEATPARVFSAEEMQQRERIQEHLAQRSPWLQ